MGQKECRTTTRGRHEQQRVYTLRVLEKRKLFWLPTKKVHFNSPSFHQQDAYCAKIIFTRLTTTRYSCCGRLDKRNTSTTSRKNSCHRTQQARGDCYGAFRCVSFCSSCSRRRDLSAGARRSIAPGGSSRRHSSPRTKTGNKTS